MREAEPILRVQADHVGIVLTFEVPRSCCLCRPAPPEADPPQPRQKRQSNSPRPAARSRRGQSEAPAAARSPLPTPEMLLGELKPVRLGLRSHPRDRRPSTEHMGLTAVLTRFSADLVRRDGLVRDRVQDGGLDHGRAATEPILHFGRPSQGRPRPNSGKPGLRHPRQSPMKETCPSVNWA